LSGDGDPCDVIVANTPAILPGALMSCKVIGVLLMRDEIGLDEKIVAIPSGPLTELDENVENYTDLPEITVRQIEHFEPLQGFRSGQVGQDRALGKCR